MADEELERLVTVIGYAVDEASRRKVESSNEAMGAKSVAVGNLISGAISKGADLALGFVRSLVGGLADAVQGFADYGDEIAKTAAKVGTGSTELQRLRFAAGRSGAETNQLSAALRKLNVGLTEAATKGTGPFAEGLGLVGLRLEDVKGKGTEETFGVIADALNDIEDPAERAAAASRLFGEESGPALLPLLAEGKEGIKALGDEAERLGLVLGEDTLGEAEALNDALGDLEMQAKVLGVRVGAQLAPYVTDLANRTATWVAENSEFIEQDLPRFIEGVVEAFVGLVQWTMEVADETEQLVREIGYLRDEAVDLITPLVDLHRTVGEALTPALEAAAAPLVAVAEGIGAITGAIGDGIARILDYIGVLDTLREAWNKLPFVGESVDELTARLHGQQTGQRGAPGFADPVAEEARVRRNAEAGLAAAHASNVAAFATLLNVPDEEGETQEQRERRRRRERFRKQLGNKGGGGGSKGKSEGPSSSETLGFMWERLTGQAEPGMLDKLGSALGIGGTGGPVSHVAAGGGGSPLAGAAFNRVDASIHAPTTIELHLPESMGHLGAAAAGEQIAELIKDKLDARNRMVFAHQQQAVRGL